MKVSKKEIAKFQQKEQARIAGREVNRVQDRKTGEFYNPQEAFDAMMKDPEFLAAAKKFNADVDPKSGDEISKVIDRVLASSPQVFERVRKTSASAK